MKKTQILLLILICLLPCFITACNGEDDPKKYLVTFSYTDGGVYKYADVYEGETVAMPQDPGRKNYTFIGWFTDKSNGTRYDFSQPITENTTLYARFELDALSITNEISKNVAKGIVKVYSRSYNDILWGTIETGSTGWSQGSGFCFDAGNGYYYVLTNCHVAVKDPDYENLEIIIEDYKGNEYDGYIYESSVRGEEAISSDYDLACVYFKSSSTEVEEIPIAKSNPRINDDVVSVSAPDGQSNAITFGQVNGYTRISLSNTPSYESNVSFDVIIHSAGKGGGASGGALLSSDLEVVGVHYAGGSLSGYAIPVEKVWEFLDYYCYN